jgi:hypothetical protein
MAITNIILSANLAHLGLDLQELNAKATDIERTNLQLELQLSESGSLSTISEAFISDEFTSDLTLITLPTIAPVAYNPQ